MSTEKNPLSFGETLKADFANGEVFTTMAELFLVSYKKYCVKKNVPEGDQSATPPVLPGPETLVAVNGEEGTALLALQMNLSPELRRRFIQHKTFDSLWAALSKEMGGTNLTRLQKYLKQITSFEFENNGMALEMDRLETIIRQAISANGAKEEIKIGDLALWMLLFALPEPYSHVRSILQKDAAMTMEEAKETIKREEESIKSRSSGIQGNVNDELCPHGRIDKPPTKYCWICHPEKNPFTVVCRDCSKKGHKSRDSKRCKLNKVDRPLQTPDPANPGITGAILPSELTPMLNDPIWDAQGIWNVHEGIPFVGAVTDSGKRKCVSEITSAKKLTKNDLRHQISVDYPSGN